MREKDPDNLFYVWREVGGFKGAIPAYHTQYGHTSTLRNLELHIGDHVYRKRGGLNKAFSPDPFDYRYESLMKSLGICVHRDEIIGCFLGNFYEVNAKGHICFRVSETDPSDILIIWRNIDQVFDTVRALDPVALNDNGVGTWMHAVFSLARKNVEDADPKFYDDMYDFSPDSVDAIGSHWADDLTESEIIAEPLKLCGF